MRGLLVFCQVLLLSPICFAQGSPASIFEWSEMPALTAPRSGQIAGQHNGALIAASGANFLVSPWQGGEKLWLEDVWVLDPGADAWRQLPDLPQAYAYGAVASTAKGVINVGGSDGVNHFDDAFLLNYANGDLKRTDLPPAPTSVAFTSAALLENVLYVVGGLASPDATETMDNFWALNLGEEDLSWKALPTWPGPPRMLPVVAAQDGAVFVMSGTDLHAGPDGEAARSYLNDAYKYTPGTGWSRIADMPHPVVAGVAAPLRDAFIAVVSGDDGSLYAQTAALGDDHPGFRKDVLSYHTITDTWSTVGEAPKGLVTTIAVPTPDGLIIMGGEDRPGHRDGSILMGTLKARVGGLGGIDYALMAGYFGLLVAMGVYFARREKTTEQFFLGGRNIKWWVAGLSIFGTQLSAITFLSIPARAYATDWVYFMMNMGIILVAPFAIYFFIPVFCRQRITTAYEYLEKRFGLAARIYGSGCFMLFQLGRIGIVLLLPALALSATTGIPVVACILAMGILATIYTVLGGIEAVIWTDVCQVVVLLLGAIVSVIVIATSLDGGLSGIIATANANAKLHMINEGWSASEVSLWVLILGPFFINFYPYAGDQTVVQRYITTPDTKQAQRAAWTNAIMSIPASLLFFGLGTALYVYYKSLPEQLDPSLKNDAIFPLFMVQALPTGMAGLVIAGVFAAAMSSLDSSMNSAATVIVTDYVRRFKQNLSDGAALRIARWVTFIFGAAGTLIAIAIHLSGQQSMLQLYMKFLGMAGGGLTGLFCLAVFTRRGNGFGVLVGVVVSAAALFYVANFTELHGFLHAMVAAVSFFVSGYVASLLAGGAKKELAGLTAWTLDDAEGEAGN
jgi:SSS family transporter